jgi:tellurite resistance protein
LINVGLFFAALVALQVPALLRLPFAMSFWALSFPLGRTDDGGRSATGRLSTRPYRVAGLALLLPACLTILVLALRTIRAVLLPGISANRNNPTTQRKTP